MYNSYLETLIGAQKWVNLATSYNDRAEKILKSHGSRDSVLYCFKGFDRCIEMCEACLAHADAMKSAYLRRQEYENIKKEREKLAADFKAKQDKKFILVIGYLVLILIVILFADIWIPFIEWLAHLF